MEDPVQDVGLELRFEEKPRSQDIVMKGTCTASIRNSINSCKCCYPGKWQYVSQKEFGLWS